MPSTQTGQFYLYCIMTPLGTMYLLLQSFTGEEGISQLFKFQLELFSQKAPVSLEAIIG